MADNGLDPAADAPTQPRQTGEWFGATLPPAGETAPAAPPLPVDAVPGYELLGEIGRGGMGVVYRARHFGLNRIVALKMVLAGPHAKAADLHRFRAEAEAVARLQHPNVVQVHDIGEANGLPYLSLELCAGSLADRLDGTPWPPRPAAELVETLARAVEAAHQAGVLHRDIKPANVLMASRERERPELGHEKKTPVAYAPGSLGHIPKITDFGLAKRIDGSGAGPTVTGAILGTPSYMAPEQAGRMVGDSRATAGPPVDVYALGAILYELLTGRPPFVAASPLDTLLQVTRDEPVAPGRLNPKTPRDLQTICLKCLEKEPNHRYATAAALADDLTRYLADQPIAARPAGRFERAWKWTKRRPAQAALIAVSSAAVLALIAGSWYFTSQLSVERDNAMKAKLDAEENARRAEDEALKARRNNYVLAMGQAQLAWQQSAVDRLKNLLRGQAPNPGEEDLRGFEWHYWRHVARGAPRTLRIDELHPSLHAIAYSSDGKLLAGLSGAGRVHIWDSATGALARVIDAKGEVARTLTFRPGGRQLAVGVGNRLSAFDAATGVALWQTSLGDTVNGAAYTPDGSRLLVRVGAWLHALDSDRGTIVRRFDKANDSKSQGVLVSPDGRRAIVAGFPGYAYDIDSGAVVRKFDVGGRVMALSPDGETMALLADDRDSGTAQLLLISTATGRVMARARAHSDFEAAVAFSPDGSRIATTGNDNTARLWSSSIAKEVRRFQGGSRRNAAVAFSPDGQSLSIATHDGTIETWPLDLDQEGVTRKAHGTVGTKSLALFPEADRVLASGLFDVQIEDVARKKTLVPLGGRGRGVSRGAVNADGRRAAAGFNAGAVVVWDVESKKPIQSFSNMRHYIAAVAFSADGKRLAAASRADVAPDGGGQSRPGGAPDRIIVWDVDTGNVVRELAGPELEQANSLALSADGRQLITGSGKLIARLWDVDSGRLVHTLSEQGGADWATTVAISPDGLWAAFASNIRAGSTGDSAVQVFDLASGARMYRLEVDQGTTRKLSFSPDSKRLASAGSDDTIRLWDLATGQEVLSRPGPHNIVDLAFGGDGFRLSALGADGTLRTWGSAP